MSRTETGEYRCNYCKANLTQREISDKHITLEIGHKTGLYSEGVIDLPGWRKERHIPPGVYNFCSSGCVVEWIGFQLFGQTGDAV